MDDSLGSNVNVSRRRKRELKNKNEPEGRNSISGGSSDEFAVLPTKRVRNLESKPLGSVNSYASIKSDLLREKQKQRKRPVRRLKTPKEARLRDDYDEDEDAELKISARMVDRIAALNDGKRTKVGMANCFEDKTALDCIDICLKESENMQEDAVALAIATNVYSLRVDRTHNDAQETRYTFIRGKSDAEKAMLLATGENLENTKDKRRKKKAEKDAEARTIIKIDDGHELNNVYQSEHNEVSETDNFDYTFGLKFPVGSCSLQHWSFTQEFIERVENRRLDVRKSRKKRKLMSWKKIPSLNFCTIYTDFIQATANLESDQLDALATFRAQKDITGKIIILHSAMVRKPASQSVYSRNMELSTVKKCRDMLANVLQQEPTTWENYLLEDNPYLYKTYQYLKTGDMTGYVFQERPFYHHFDPEEESADDPSDTFSYVEKNADNTLYTFKKPPKGTALARLAPFIRIPVNKYANPRNRKIEDVYFKEDIGVESSLVTVNKCDLMKLAASVWKQIEAQNLCGTDFGLLNLSSPVMESAENTVEELGEDEEMCAEDNGKSLLVRLKDRHRRHQADFERLNSEFKQTARNRCSNIVKELSATTRRLTKDANEEGVDEEDLKEWKTSRFLDIVGSSGEKSFHEKLHDVFSQVFTSSHVNDSEVEQRRKIVASVVGSGSETFEWLVPKETIISDISHVMKRGIDSVIRYVDATYHMKVFKFEVTVEQAHESLRQAERLGAGMTPEELAALKKRCFRPGRYNGIRDSGEVSRSYRIDPWSLDPVTKSFSEHYFSCCSYPKLEGALLQLLNDIHEATKKIPSNSWYYTRSSAEAIDDDRKNWEARLNEAMSLFTSYMSKSEEKSLRDRRALPKLPQRSRSSRSKSQSVRVLEKPEMEHLPSTSGGVEMNNSNEVSHGDPLTSCNYGGNDDDNDGCGDAGSTSSFIFPDDACAGIEKEVRSISDRSVARTETAANSMENLGNDTSRKNRSKLDNVDEPPKKREKKVKSEPEVKVEPLEKEYFMKSDVHTSVPLNKRFSIADPRTLTRSEDVIFMRPKLLTRTSLSEYKFEDFVKPGFLHKGNYPGIKLEVNDSIGNDGIKFIGTLTRYSKSDEPCTSTVVPFVEQDVYDAWLTTFGGFRVSQNGHLAFDAPQCLPLGREDEVNPLDSENVDVKMEDSFNDSIFYPSNSTLKKDRFNDIRPDEFKAIGIDVKSLLPKKDFYSMTKEERAAAVAAEFEAIDALGPKKEDGHLIKIMDISFRVVAYHLNTAKMKRVMKSILSNPLLAYDKMLYARRALLARRRAVERNKNQDLGPEVYFKNLDRTLDTSLGPIAEKILERHNPVDITALDPVDVLEAVAYRNLDEVNVEEQERDRSNPSNTGVEESMRQFAAEVRQADFKVQGLHTFSSIIHCLPRRMGSAGKNVNIANALAVTLYLCNENNLTLVQERKSTKDRNVSVSEGEPWMANCIITNAVDADILHE